MIEIKNLENFLSTIFIHKSEIPNLLLIFGARYSWMNVSSEAKGFNITLECICYSRSEC